MRKSRVPDPWRRRCFSTAFLAGDMVARKDTPVTTTASPIGITGSTGQLGGRVASRLATLGHHLGTLLEMYVSLPMFMSPLLACATERWHTAVWECTFSVPLLPKCFQV